MKKETKKLKCGVVQVTLKNIKPSTAIWLDRDLGGSVYVRFGKSGVSIGTFGVKEVEFRTSKKTILTEGRF